MNEFIQILKLPRFIIFVISICTGFLLFMPASIIAALGLELILQQYKGLVGVTFLLTTVLFISYFLFDVVKLINRFFKFLQLQSELKKDYLKLRREERMVLIMIFRTNDLTSKLPYTSGTVKKLIDNGMIVPTTTTMITEGYDLRTPFTLTNTMRIVIEKNQNWLNDFNFEELQKLFNDYNSLRIF